MAGQGTARPKPDTASVAFLIATDRSGQDVTTREQRRYVNQVINAAQITRQQYMSPAIVLRDTHNTPERIATQIKQLDPVIRSGKIPQIRDPQDPNKQINDPHVNSTLDQHFGELRENTLIIDCHGIEVTWTPADISNTGFRQRAEYSKRNRGLLLYNHGMGANPLDLELLVRHLQNMKTQQIPGKGPNDLNVVPDKRKLSNLKQNEQKYLFDDEIARTRAEVPRYAKLMDAIRNSKFDNVYLLACADPPVGFTAVDSRLGRFARLWHKLTNQNVYYNDEAVFAVFGQNIQTYIKVGGGASLTNGKPGYHYWKKQSVQLITNATSFLEGSTHRYPRY
jgi:hypothetical protein